MTLFQSVAEKFGSVEKGYDFKFDREIREQVGSAPLPFSGMDKSQNQMCELFLINRCQLGKRCCYRHVRTDKSIVCKHWLRGLCKKGDDCEFLHQYDTAKMPVCYFFSNFGRCENKDCMYQHVSSETKTQSCPWYARGFCKHGAACKRKHVRKVMCPNYLVGFCPEGPDCEFEHPGFDLPLGDGEKGMIKCHFCGEPGHKSNVCPKNPHALPTEITNRHNEILARVADPGQPTPKAGMPLSKNYLDSRPEMQQKLEEDKTIYSVPTLGDDSEKQPKVVGIVGQENSNQFGAENAADTGFRKRRFRQSDMGYGDGEAWGDEAVKKKMREEREKERQNFAGNFGGNFNGNGNFGGGNRGGFGGQSRGGYSNRGGRGGFQGGNRDLRDKSQVTCFKCLQTGHYANECTIPKGQAGPGYNNFNANKMGRGGSNLGAAPISDEQRSYLQQQRTAREGNKVMMKPWGDV